MISRATTTLVFASLLLTSIFIRDFARGDSILMTGGAAAIMISVLKI
jgi:hypothetical protein